MGLMRFVISPPTAITEEVAGQAYLCGLDRVPWEIHARYNSGELVLERMVSDSAILQIPWQIEGYGQAMLSTGTLMERPEPYHLPLELARGKIGQIRSQQAEWEAIGLAVPEPIQQALAEATRYLAMAIQTGSGSEESAALAERAIHIALTTSTLLAGCYAEQALAVRRRLSPRLATLLGANLGATVPDEALAAASLPAFNAAGVPLSWRDISASEDVNSWDVADRQIQWCRRHQLAVCGGPLLHFDPYSAPDWLCVCQGNFDTLLTFVAEHLQAVVQRYRDQVDLWICAARVNTGELLSLTEEEKVRLAARAVELVRSVDPQKPILVSFDQPWAEYLSHRAMDFPPLHFADALVRAGLGLSGLHLEINLGYVPGGTPLRDPLDFSRQLDNWGVLGVPLYVSLVIPSATHDDPLARRRLHLAPDSWNLRSQQAWANQYAMLLLAKPYVQGIFWNQLRDYEPHEFPHGGLFDLRRQPKPALRQLATLRQTMLK
jgi:hypothetical protein